MPRVGMNSIILVDGSTMILPPVVRLFAERDGYALTYGRDRAVRMTRLPRHPNRHQVARALLRLNYERPDESRGYATAANPPAASLFASPRGRRVL